MKFGEQKSGGICFLVIFIFFKYITVKLLMRNKLVLRNHFLWPICHLLHKDKELLALKNNFRATKKVLIAKFNCSIRFFRTFSAKNQNAISKKFWPLFEKRGGGDYETLAATILPHWLTSLPAFVLDNLPTNLVVPSM